MIIHNLDSKKDMSNYLESSFIESIRPLSASFIKSAVSFKDSIPSEYAEIAILGRSNVGKSSFINLLLNHRLAKSSSTPGKTRLINFFEVIFEIKFREDSNKNIDIELKTLKLPLIIIDFPGFGYAKVDKKTRNLWDKNLSDFLVKRTSIKLFCHLIDARHRNLEMDKNIRDFLKSILGSQGREDYEIVKIYTKADKLKQNEIALLRKNNDLIISSVKKNEADLFSIYKILISKNLGF